MSGCDPSTDARNDAAARAATARPLDIAAARAQLADLAAREITAGRPLRDTAVLSARLRIPPGRAMAIGNGAGAGAVPSPTAALRLGYNCAPGVCICTGDRDCNDLFSTVCRDTSTGGQCWESNGKTVCICHPMMAHAPT